MKRLIVPAVFLAVIALSAYTVKAQSSSSNDDLYYSPNSSTDNSAPNTSTQQQNNNSNTQNYYNRRYNNQYNNSNRYQNSSEGYSTTDSSKGNTYVTNNYYGNGYGGGGFNPYMNYAYDPFYSGLGFGFSDMIYPGFSLGLGYGFGYPGFGYPYYSPFYNPYSFYNPYYNPYYGYGEGFSYYSPGYGGQYHGLRRYEASNTRTVTNGSRIYQTSSVATRGASPVSSSRVSQVPFSRPATSYSRAETANRQINNNRGVPRSGYRTATNPSARPQQQRAATASRSMFAPRGGFSAYQNNRSISSYHPGMGGRSNSYSGYSGGRSNTGSFSRSSSGSFGGGSSTRSFSGGGSGGGGGRRH